MRAEYAVSLHDVAPDTLPECRLLLDILDGLRVPVTLLVVPHYHHRTRVDADPGFATFLKERLARGDDVVLHGYYHLDDAPAARGPLGWLRRRIYTAGEGEFDSLDEATARARLSKGRELLTRIGAPPSGFIAPAWLLGPAAARAVRALGFAYTSARESLSRPADGMVVAAPSLVASTRAGWRRIASRIVIASRLALLARAPRVRVALHPADAHHPSIVASWRRSLAVLGRARAAVLERAWLESLPLTTRAATTVAS
jgi:uncharacterized protein